MRPQRSSVDIAQPRTTHHLTGHRAGDVTLGVAGTDQHEWDGRDMAVAVGPQLFDRVGERGRRQLDEPAVGRNRCARGQPGAGALDQPEEVLDAVGVLGAVPHN